MNIRSILLAFSALTLVSALAGCGASHSAGRSEVKNVFGDDDRMPLTTSDYPWRTIGIVDAVGRCTGVLVQREWVLTAAHCVIDPATRTLTTNPVKFSPNYKHGSAPTSARAVYTYWGTTNPNAFRGNDWALLKLEEPLGDTFGWLGIRHTDVDSFPSRLTVVGYSSSYLHGETAGVHHNCSLRGRNRDNGFILHDCDATRGSSGGPALRMYEDALTVVGLNVSERRDGGDVSLNISEYSDKYANISIPSKGFLRKLKEVTNR